MPSIWANSWRKWFSNSAEMLITITSAVVFFFLDFLDVVMCIFFRVFDRFLEGKPSSCYCTKMGSKEEGKTGVYEIDGESELSGTLYGRQNVFRNLGLLRMRRRLNKEGAFGMEERNRWSDCGCETCLSWMNNGPDLKLHVVVKEPERARLESGSAENTMENVLFVHGFLSSSAFWTETVFPNLSEQTMLNYKLFAVDLLGFGRSPKPRDCMYTLRDHLEMIEKSVIHPFQVNSCHLVAHSMGCVIALALAAKYSASVKSITLIAPPYFPSSKEDVSLVSLRRLAARKIWPPLLFGSAFMSWYEHLGRGVCFLICRNHKTWEWILKLLAQRRDIHFALMDITRHTHHSAWHTMHNVICGGAKLLDKYLDVLRKAEVEIHIFQGSNDKVVPLECSYNMKMKAPNVDLNIVPNADHQSVIIGREKDFTRSLESIWTSKGKSIAGNLNAIDRKE